jgi:putative ABC transport system ATP-binding protein
LLRLMSGLLMPDAGTVQLGDTPLPGLSETARRDFRLRHIGLVFQDFALLDYLTVEENVLLPQRFAGLTNDVAERGHELAQQLDLAPHWHRLAGKLSQGERQRVAIVRALAHRPKYVFADEPTASLDAARRTLVMDLLLDYTRQTQACLVMVTHDPELMAHFPNQVRVEDFAA